MQATHRDNGTTQRGGHGNRRLIRLALLGALAALVLVLTAAAPPPACHEGASSLGPAVLVNGHLNRQQSDLTPETDACLSPGVGHAS